MAIRGRGSWSFKLTLVLAIAYAQIAINGLRPQVALSSLVALIVSAILLALYAHHLNDIFDIEVDARVGKPNSAAMLRPAVRVVRTVVFAVAGFLPWLFIDPGRPAFGALFLIYVLPIVYSAPPVRLKDRSSLGLVSDAVMAHVAPAAFASLLFIHLVDREPSLATYFLVASLVWSLFLGLRSILIHQLGDYDGDVITGTGSFVVRHGVERTRWLITRIVFLGEFVSLAALWTALFSVNYSLGAFFALYLTFYLVGKFYWKVDLDPAPNTLVRPPALHQFYAVWPALVLAIYLAIRDPLFLTLVLFQITFFWPELKEAFRTGRAVVRRLVAMAMKRPQETG